MLFGATMVSAPAHATTDVLVRFCQGFLDQYDTVLARYEVDRAAGHQIHLARYHYYLHMRRKLQATAEFCVQFLDDRAPPVSRSQPTNPVVNIHLIN